MPPSLIMPAVEHSIIEFRAKAFQTYYATLFKVLFSLCYIWYNMDIETTNFKSRYCLTFLVILLLNRLSNKKVFSNTNLIRKELIKQIDRVPHERDAKSFHLNDRTYDSMLRFYINVYIKVILTKSNTV